MTNNRNSGEVNFKILRKIGTVMEYQTGWAMEFNVVSWNGGVPKYDIRNWSPTHDRMTKGITLYDQEAKELAKVLYEVMVKGNDNLQTELANYKASSGQVAEEVDEEVAV